MSLLDMFSRYNKTNYKAGFLLEDPLPLARSEIHVRAPEFVAPRKLDFRDMCVRSSNQGNTPHCCGFGTAGFIEIQNWRIKHYPEQVNGHAVYYEAKKLDGYPGDGSYVRYAVQAALTMGLTEGIGKHIGRDRMDLKFAIHQYYACIGALRITDEWNLVEKRTGIISNFGSNAKQIGGHCVLVVGYDDYGVYIQNSWGCYSDDTEILTKDGWKLFKDISDNERVITIDPISKKMEYQKIKQKYVYEFNGYMHHYENSKIDLMVTPNHKILYRKQTSPDYKLEESQKCPHSDFRLRSLRWGEWEGKEQDIISICGHAIKMDLWLEFLGYFISEGHTYKHSTYRDRSLEKKGKYIQNNYIVGVSQVKHVEKFRRCLEQMPFKFSYYGHTFTTNSRPLFEYLSRFGKSWDKYIPEKILGLSKRQLGILYEALMLGDGSQLMCKNGHMRRSYYTSSKLLSGQFQELCLKLGYATSVKIDNRIGKQNSQGRTYRHINYHIGIQQDYNESMYPKPLLKEYHGKVYCVEVPKNHTLFVRRNGKTIWSGNSDWALFGFALLSWEQWDRQWMEGMVIEPKE